MAKGKGCFVAKNKTRCVINKKDTLVKTFYKRYGTADVSILLFTDTI